MRLIFSIGFLLLSVSSSLSQEVQMAEGMRSDGKIYVVVGVVLIILIGLFLYLFALDKKVSRIEKLKDE